MAAMVNSDGHTTAIVFRYLLMSWPGEKPRTAPEISAAMRIAVPDADSQLKMNTAASGVGFATTGGILNTILSSPDTGMFGADNPLRKPLTCGVPHANTITMRMIHGIS